MTCAAVIQKVLSRLYPHMVIVLSITLLSLRIFYARIGTCQLSLNIRNNAVKSAPMSEIRTERFVWSNEKANEFIEEMNSEEIKNNADFLQENVYLDAESCLMCLCNY